MKTLKKALAAVSSFVLAFALAVPAVAWAVDEDMAVRVTYNGNPIVISALDTVPHSLVLTFHTHEDYEGYANVEKTTTFTLADDLKGLRVSHCAKNADGSYSVAISDGNAALPMTDGRYLDLGVLDVKVNGTVDYTSPAASQMTEAVIAVTQFQASDGDYAVASRAGTEAQPAIEIPFTLAASSFATVVGTPPTGGNTGGVTGGEDVFVPTFSAGTPSISVPSGVSAPSADTVKNSLNPLVEGVLKTVWDGGTPEGLKSGDAEKLASFIQQVRAAGLTLADVQVQYLVNVVKYDDDVPADDLSKLVKEMNAYESLGYYDLSVSMVLSVPTRPDIVSTTAAFSRIDSNSPLSFTVDVEKGKLDNKDVAVRYVHTGAVKAVSSGVVADAQNNTVTFSAYEFSTYGVYAKPSGSDPTPRLNPIGSLIDTGDGKAVLMLGLGAALLIACVVVVFAGRRRTA